MSVFSAAYFTPGGARALNTVYQNTSIYGLLVIASTDGLGWNSAGIRVITGEVGATSGLGTEVFREQTASASLGNVQPDTAFFFVPAGYYYQVHMDAAATFTEWSEFTIIAGSGLASIPPDLGPSGSNTRALATPYTNSSGHGIIVLVSLTAIPVGVNAVGISDSATTYQVNCETVFGGGLYNSQTVKVFVPDGDAYQITCAGSTINSWREYALGLDFTEVDASTILAVNPSSATKNTAIVPWFVTAPLTGTSGPLFKLLTDSSNPPTTDQFHQGKATTFTPTGNATVTGVVMPGDYVKVISSAGTGISNVGNARLYSINGIPFGGTPILTFHNP